MLAGGISVCCAGSPSVKAHLPNSTLYSHLPGSAGGSARGSYIRTTTTGIVATGRAHDHRLSHRSNLYHRQAKNDTLKPNKKVNLSVKLQFETMA